MNTKGQTDFLNSNSTVSVFIFLPCNLYPHLLRKSGYIILSLLLLLQAGGLLLFYEGQELYAHWRMHRATEKDRATELLKLKAADYTRCRIGDDELLWHGKMFDVQTVKGAGDSVLLAVVHDEHEEWAIGEIARILQGPLKEPDAIPEPLLVLLSFVYLLPEVYHVPLLPMAERTVFVTSGSTILDRSVSIFFPPPEC